HGAIQLFLGRTHCVFNQLRLAFDKRYRKELLCLTSKGPLQDRTQSTTKLHFLSFHQTSVLAVLAAKDLTEDWQLAEQCVGRLHELDQAPKFREGILNRSRRQQ